MCVCVMQENGQVTCGCVCVCVCVCIRVCMCKVGMFVCGRDFFFNVMLNVNTCDAGAEG